jgi:hypothetical protein
LTTDRERRANRANAKSSTGPKTASGKARSAQNALRHGLNVSTLLDPALAPLAEAMARRIAAMTQTLRRWSARGGSPKPKSISIECAALGSA